MFYDIERFPFLQDFINNAELVFNEWNKALNQSPALHKHIGLHTDLDAYTDYWVKDNGFHPNQIGYDIREGYYNTFAIFKKGYPIKNYDIPSLFPALSGMLNHIPNMHYAGFFRMEPLSELMPHTHSRKHLIFHVLLNDLENGACKMICNNKEKELRHRGDAVLFDYSASHATINASTTERINFVIDFNPFNDV